MKQIFLGQVQGPLERTPTSYRVKKLVNSNQFRIGEKLTDICVTSLCSNAAWTVTITYGTL